MNNLYQHGDFDAALRLAQIGNPDKPHQAGLYSAAALAALELRVGRRHVWPDREIPASSTQARRRRSPLRPPTPRRGARPIARCSFVDQALKAQLDKDEKLAAVLQKGQAKFQAGDVAGRRRTGARCPCAHRQRRGHAAIPGLDAGEVAAAGRKAFAIMRQMLSDSPGNVGLMNNFGYSLVDDYASQAELLDEGLQAVERGKPPVAAGAGKPAR